ncbi:MAG TPA: anaerobic sulfatase maturase [Fimbriimonadaceae bacterium]|nr:anaerobic sulfatase maturase [Fimbriimonadaceae bacterium]
MSKYAYSVPMETVRKPRSFHLLAKPTGAVCNLDCTYCFYLSKEALYPGSPFRMSDEVLESYVRQLLGSIEVPDVNIAFQGGEPTLMGRSFFEKAAALARRYRKPNQNLVFSIQTNGTRIDKDWCEFFRENQFLVGLSIDGPKDVHDAYRVNKGGKGTFDRVLEAWELMKAKGVDVNILCTVHAANQDRGLETYRFFRDELGAEFLQFIPIVERATSESLEIAERGWHDKVGGERPLYEQVGELATSRSVGPDAYGRFLIEIFDEWVKSDVGKVFVQMFDVTLGSYFGLHSLCIFAPTCGDALALEHNGDLYSCDHFVEPKYRLGNIVERRMEDLVALPLQKQFGRDKRDTLPKMCRDCDVLFACNGGCPKDRFVTTPHGEPGLNYLCSGLLAFFRHSRPKMERMAALLKSEKLAADIMREQW